MPGLLKAVPSFRWAGFEAWPTSNTGNYIPFPKYSLQLKLDAGFFLSALKHCNIAMWLLNSCRGPSPRTLKGIEWSFIKPLKCLGMKVLNILQMQPVLVRLAVKYQSRLRGNPNVIAGGRSALQPGPLDTLCSSGLV